MIDWDALVVAPTREIFGEPVAYEPHAGSPIFAGQTITNARGSALPLAGVFDEAHLGVGELGDRSVVSARPLLGIRLADMPIGFDPEQVQGDRFTVMRTGQTYIVRTGRTDSHGWCLLEANLTR